MSAHIIACGKEVRLHQTKVLHEKIALLYAHVFLFLEDIMKWYLTVEITLLRLRNSFRQTFNQQLEDMVVTIQDHSIMVQREANLISIAETRQSRLTVEDIRSKVGDISLTAGDTLEELKLAQVDRRLSTESNSREQADLKRENERLRQEVQREREKRLQLELNGPHWMEVFRSDLVSQVATGVRQELVGVAGTFTLLNLASPPRDHP